MTLRIDPDVTEFPKPIPWNDKCVCEVKNGKLEICAMHALKAKKQRTKK